MTALMRFAAGAAVFLSVGTLAGQSGPALAQQAQTGQPVQTGQPAQAAQSADTAALLKRIEDQERRIEALEHRLQEQQARASAGAAPSPAPPAVADAAAPGAPPVPEKRPEPSSTATAGATAAVSGKAAVAAATPIEAAPGFVRAGAAGFFLQSADGTNVIRLRGNLATDGRWFSDDSTPASANTWLFRRVRPYIEGTFHDIYDFRFMPDFAGGKTVIVDAFVTGRFAPWFAVQAGKFKGPVGLERLQPDQFNRFIELGLPSSLVPNRDLGVEIGGDFAGGTLGYAVGSFDGVTDGNSTDSNPTPDAGNAGKRDVEGRLFTQPFIRTDNAWLRGFGIGAGGTYVNLTGSATNTLLPTYKTPGQQNFFTYRTGSSATYADGRRSRLSPQFYYYAGPFGVLGEYVESSQDVSRQVSTAVRRSARLDNSAWQVQLNFFLTGEKESYNGFTPNSTFAVGEPGWGAWELVARYHELKIDEAAFAGAAASFADPAVSPRRARAAAVGLNWYLNQNVKWLLDYERTRFDGGATTGNRPDENAILTRFWLTF